MEKYNDIPAEKFKFVNLNEKLHDKKFNTKAKGFLADAFSRFKKNKASVIAMYIIVFLLLFAIFAPILSPYTIQDKDIVYNNYPPFIRSFADMGIGLFDGGKPLDSQNDNSMLAIRGIYEETGYNPLIKTLNTTYQKVIIKGQEVEQKFYKVKINAYYYKGIQFMTMDEESVRKLMAFQNETGIQVIYPWVEPRDIQNISDAPNIWYKVDRKGIATLDEEGNFQPVYCKNKSYQAFEYDSLRIAGDDGSYIYARKKDAGSIKIRVCYYNYYQYINGHEPSYIFGTDEMGKDLFMLIGVGARFSLIFAIVVSLVNVILGVIYGSIEGYYGGITDLAMERVSDILSGVPSLVVITLFQYHLAPKLGATSGPVMAFFLAFIATGWIGMASLTRKQFYRFKSQEYVMAARTLGASDSRLMFKHILPNSLGTMITSCALIIPGVISSETSLTYLGIIDLSNFAGTSLGSLIQQGNAADWMATPHALFFPTLFLALLLITFNLFGNGLRDAFNPSTRGIDD